MALSDFNSVATSMAALVAAGVAFVGLRTWREQLTGRTEYELARRLFRRVLEVRDAIAAARHPFMSAAELSEAVKRAGIEAKPEDAMASRLAYGERWNRVSNALSDMQVDLLEAEVLWGDAIQSAASELHGCAATLYGAIRAYLREIERDGPFRDAAAEQRAIDHFDRSSEIVFLGAAGSDAFADRVQGAVQQFEGLLRPKLRLD